MQAALVPVKPESGDAGSSLGGEAQADANANSEMNQAAAQMSAVGMAGDGDGSPAIAEVALSGDGGSAALPRAAVEGVAAAAKWQGANVSEAGGAGAASEGAFAQAVSAAGVGAGASPQAANGASAAVESRGFAQATPAAETPQLPQSTATLAANANSEMRLAMQTDLLGSIDLRAAMHQSTLTATIGVQRADVQTLLANELPALQHALAEKNLQVGQISVLNNHAGGAFDSRNSGQDPRHGQAGGQTALTIPYMQRIGPALGEEASVTASELCGGVTAGRVNVVV